MNLGPYCFASYRITFLCLRFLTRLYQTGEGCSYITLVGEGMGSKPVPCVAL